MLKRCTLLTFWTIFTIHGMERHSEELAEAAILAHATDITEQNEVFSYPVAATEDLSPNQKKEIRRKLNTFDPKKDLATREEAFKLAALYLADKNLTKVSNHKFNALLQKIYAIEQKESKKHNYMLNEVLGCLTYEFDTKIKYLEEIQKKQWLNCAYETQKTIIIPAREKLSTFLEHKKIANDSLQKDINATELLIEEHQKKLEELQKKLAEQTDRKKELFTQEQSLRQADIILEKESLQRLHYLNELLTEHAAAIEEKKESIETLIDDIRQVSINSKNLTVLEKLKKELKTAEKELETLEKEKKELEFRVSKFNDKPSSTRSFGKIFGW